MGIEPTTSGTTNRRSNQLSYSHHKTEVIITAYTEKLNLKPLELYLWLWRTFLVP